MLMNVLGYAFPVRDKLWLMFKSDIDGLPVSLKVYRSRGILYLNAILLADIHVVRPVELWRRIVRQRCLQRVRVGAES